MRINSINSYQNNSNKTNFGMAFYMPEYSKMSKKIGKYLADEAEKARPALEEMSKDVNIAVLPRVSNNLEHLGFNIYVSKIEERIKNPIKRFFHRPEYVKDDVRNFEIIHYHKSMSELLIDTADELKSKLFRYIGN